MALRTDRNSNVPEGTVRLTESEALAHQKNVIRDWPRETDVLFLRYAGHLSCLSSLTTSFLIVKYLKNTLAVGNRGLIYTFTPSIVIPGYVSYLAAEKVLTNNILLMKMDCPLCYQMKFAAAQLYAGVVFPAAFSYFSYACMAMAENTVNIPNVKTHAREFWKYSYGVLKRGATTLQFSGLIHTLVILFLPYLQSKQMATLMENLQNIQKNETEDNFSVSFQSDYADNSVANL